MMTLNTHGPGVKLVYFDHTTRIVYPNGRETPFPDGKLIVSRTDLAGLITHCNQAFIELSGYSAAELLGMPHHLLRHPDMPRAAFASLWQTVQAGQHWHGYVKNLCKDGSHYWVYATVIPNIRQGIITGYTSVRRKPSPERVAECIDHYARLKQTEAEATPCPTH